MFRDDRLRRLFTFQALYAGLAPQQALALFGVITYMDSVCFQSAANVHNMMACDDSVARQ